MRPEGLGKLEKIHLIGTRSRDLPVCSLVPQPLRYRVPLIAYSVTLFNYICCIALISGMMAVPCFRSEALAKFLYESISLSQK
jgi:hypothetical protein